MLSIKIDELLKLNNPNIIDIRAIQSFNNNHIASAKNIPNLKLLENPNKYLSKTQRYYIYCQKGITSLKTCQMLNRQGFNTVNIIGGYEAWMLNN